MNIKAIIIYLGRIIRLEGILMLPAAAIALYCGESLPLMAFSLTALFAVGMGQLMSRLKIRSKGIYAREGFVTVALAWIAISLIGALPFWASGAIPGFIDSWFETVSGFTTTGASILTEIESLPRSILYWRSFTHWVGGMGVLVFMLAVAPHSQGSGDTLHLLRAESPGPTVGKLTPTIRNTTRALYIIYMALTLIQVVLLLFGGMSLFDSVCHAFGTAGTGGFSTMNASIGAYPSPYIQTVIAVFMALFGVNFSIYYMMLMGNVSAALRNEELRAYLAIMAGWTVIIIANILPSYSSLGQAALDAFFAVSSIMTTTGYATADFNLWPQLSRYMLVVLMIIGASAGSTGGGVKVARLLILGKSAKSEILKLAHPQSVNTPRMDGKRIEDSVVRGTYTFMSVYTFICVVSMGLLAAIDNFSIETTVTSVLACINNIGPGLDMVGPTGNFSAFSPVSKLILSFNMLAGRLEIFPMIMLIAAGLWRRGGRKG